MEDVRFFSATEKIKSLILDLWKQTEEFYYKGENENFVRATKSLVRVLTTRIDDEDIKKLNEIDQDEQKEVDKIRMKKDMPPESKTKETKEKRYEYAEKRMDMVIELLGEVL